MKKTSWKAFLSCLWLIIFGQVACAQMKPLGAIPPTAQKAHIGVFMMNVHDIDMTANSFYADFYLWAKWEGDINPFEGLEFVNGVEDWGTTLEDLADTVVVDEDGRNYFIQRIEGRFYHAFSLERYPLDRQKFAIQIENSEFQTDELILLPDTLNTRIHADLLLPGWEILGWEMESRSHSYGTNFGEIANPKDSQFSNLAFSLNLGRPSNYFLWKLLLPLMVVVFSSIGAFFLHPKFVEARITLPVSALLTAVFLQDSYSNNLPNVSYMVLMDKIYVLSYILIIIAIIETIAMANMLNTKRRQNITYIRKIDKLFFKGQIAVLLLGLLLLVFV